MLLLKQAFTPLGRKVCQRCWKHHRSFLSSLVGETDKFNGVKVNIGQLPETLPEEEFVSLLRNSLESWRKESKSAAWLEVPIHLGKFIPSAAKFGFQFHHAEYDKCLLKLWMNKDHEDKTPRFATHQVGVSGFVFHEDTESVLVVKDKKSQFSYWKFPGGLSDLGEDIGNTAEREVFEETSVRTRFKSVIALRQQHNQPGAFGRSDFYIVCRLSPLSYKIAPCTQEISACQWMKIRDLYEGSVSISPITRRITELVLYGIKEGFDKVDINAEEMKSVYKELRFKLYHRPFNPSLINV